MDMHMFRINAVLLDFGFLLFPRFHFTIVNLLPLILVNLFFIIENIKQIQMIINYSTQTTVTPDATI